MATQNTQENLEITIAHNLLYAEEVKKLYELRWIALDFDRKGSNPSAYTGAGKTAVTLFNKMREQGAAVVASYKKATPNSATRLIGQVRAGTQFRRYKDLLCLSLEDVKVHDSSKDFVGNLVPRNCTIQNCHKRPKGKLHALVNGISLKPDVENLHHYDVEWLVTNYLILTGLCKSIWNGGRCYEAIDHIGAMAKDRELLAQTTISTSPDLVKKKADALKKLGRSDRELYLFAPREAESDCPQDVHFIAIEDLIPTLEKSDGGQWLIKRLFSPT